VKDLLLKEIREILYIKKLEMEFKSYDQSEKRVLEKGKKIRVFAVEDNSSYQRVLKTIIRRAGDMRIVGIESTGVDAIEKIKNLPEPPDVVITNIAMPVMNGILMTLELLTIYPDMKIIIISALADKIHILSAFLQLFLCTISFLLFSFRSCFSLCTCLLSSSLSFVYT